MDLTEEEKKKKQLQSNLSADEFYNSNAKQLESNRQRQLEDAYVNQQLMNKYLGTKIANTGLSNTGAENLYYSNANANYRNEIGNINANYQNSQQDLLNQYYGYKKQEKEKEEANLKEQQNALLEIYKGRVDKSLNDYNYLEDETSNDLYKDFDMNALGAENSAILENYMASHKGTADAINRKNQDEFAKSLSYKFADAYNNGTSDYNAFIAELDAALANGSINQDQYYEIKNSIDAEQQKKQTSTQQQNFDSLYYQMNDEYNNGSLDYKEYENDIWEMYQNGELNQTQYYKLKEITDAAKADSKSFEYDEQARIFGNKLLQKIDNSGKLTEEEANQFYTELDQLYKSKKIDKNTRDSLRASIQQSVETSIDADRRLLQRDYPQVDVNNYIDVDSASTSSFGDFVGVGKGKKQDSRVAEILQKARNGKFMNGTVIDFNVGLGKANYMYYNGKFYKTSEKADIKA